jgi:hypothetical protein
VASDDRTHLDLEIEIGGDPLTGVLRDGNGHVEPFSGWMALARAIDLMLDAARTDGAQP